MRRRLTNSNHRLAAVGGLLLLALAFGLAGTSAQESSIAVTVCVGADRVLRFTEDEKPCRPGEQRFLLASATVEKSADEDEKRPSPAEPDQPAERMPTNDPSEVGERKSMPTRPGQPAPQSSQKSGGRVARFVAPFEVVDRQGKTIMRVADGGVQVSNGVKVFNDEGRIVSGIGVVPGEGGGAVYVRSNTDESGRVVSLAYRSSGPFLFFKDTKGNLVCAINEEAFIWYNEQNNAAVKISAGQFGKAGRLVVADQDGKAVVEAGSLEDGRGIVRVFPNKSQTPIPIPQFLMGSKP